jgi:hypothetical protein
MIIILISEVPNIKPNISARMNGKTKTIPMNINHIKLFAV